MKIIVGGDICPIGRNEHVFSNQQDELQEAARIFSDYDLVLANLECPLIDSPSPIIKGGPVLGASTKTVSGLVSLGINAAILANNHIMDHGEAGLRSTLLKLDQFGIKHVGANLDIKSASEPLFYEDGNDHVAVLAFAEKEYSYATSTNPGACPLDVNLVVRKLMIIPKDTFTIVLIHGGNEFFPYPNPWLQDTCHLMVDLGANLVICQHSHCVGAHERYEDALIVYGQGNLAFDRYSRHSKWWEGVLISVSISENRLMDYEFIPIIQQPGGRVFRYADVPEQRRILSEIDQYSKIVVNPDQLKKEWEKFCLGKKRIYQGLLFGYNRLAYYINEFTGFADVKSKTGKMNIGNVLRCPSHLEVLRTIYSLENTSQE